MANAGAANFYEVGAGKVLSGLIKRLAGGATVSAVGTQILPCSRPGGTHDVSI
jgi:malonyl CoA-acyl carrier protein transacylase